MTPQVAATLAYIESYCAAHGYAPTIREIAFGQGYKSPQSVHGHVSRLISEGYLTRDTRAAHRQLRLRNPLAGFSDDQIVGEAQRRGLAVTA